MNREWSPDRQPYRQHCLGLSMEPDMHWIDVRLADRRVLRNLTLRNGMFITGRADDDHGENDPDVRAGDIVAGKRHGAWWPWWQFSPSILIASISTWKTS